MTAIRTLIFCLIAFVSLISSVTVFANDQPNANGLPKVTLGDNPRNVVLGSNQQNNSSAKQTKTNSSTIRHTKHLQSKKQTR